MSDPGKIHILAHALPGTRLRFATPAPPTPPIPAPTPSCRDVQGNITTIVVMMDANTPIGVGEKGIAGKYDADESQDEEDDTMMANDSPMVKNNNGKI